MQVILDHVGYEYQPGTAFAAVALRDVCLTVGNRDFLALIGHTGCGKSTLVQHLNGLLRPTSGHVYYEEDGKKTDIFDKDFDRRSLRRRVGLVFQYPEHQLFDETVAKDVAFGPVNLGLSREEIDSRVTRALERVGLDRNVIGEKSPFELSGGKMRKVAIAGVLAMEPDVLVLDEPAAGLDPQSRHDMLELINGLHAAGTGIVMVSHNMDDVARYADRILVMEQGSILREGTPEEIFSRGEELEKLGLSVPQACRLGILLRSRGIDFPECYCTEDALEPLYRLLGGRKNAQ